jgi:hypothetical protein
VGGVVVSELSEFAPQHSTCPSAVSAHADPARERAVTFPLKPVIGTGANEQSTLASSHSVAPLARPIT